MDIRNMDSLWCDDITFCQEECETTECPRNKRNIRDRTIPHSFSVEIPGDCPKKPSGNYSMDDRCVMCGVYIPEGTQVCSRCIKKHLGLEKDEVFKPEWQCGKAYCGACGRRIPPKIKARYCPKCGREIDWKC